MAKVFTQTEGVDVELVKGRGSLCVPADKEWKVEADSTCAKVNVTKIGEHEVKIDVTHLVARGHIRMAPSFSIQTTYTPD